MGMTFIPQVASNLSSQSSLPIAHFEQIHNHSVLCITYPLNVVDKSKFAQVFSIIFRTPTADIDRDRIQVQYESLATGNCQLRIFDKAESVTGTLRAGQNNTFLQKICKLLIEHQVVLPTTEAKPKKSKTQSARVPFVDRTLFAILNQSKRAKNKVFSYA